MYIQTPTLEFNRIEKNDQDLKRFYWDCPECGATLHDGDDELISAGLYDFHRTHLSETEIEHVNERRENINQAIDEIAHKQRNLQPWDHR